MQKIERLVTNYFDEIINLHPEKVAFVDAEREITFSELRRESFCVAHRLICEKVFKKPILLFLEKSVSMISLFMGVAYSGNFYSPIDVKMPEERIHKIVDTLEPEIIITDVKHREQIKVLLPDYNIWVFEELMNTVQIDVNEIYRVNKKIIDTDILYVLFTSGSTGTPKGVIINHRAVVDFIDWITNCYHFDEKTVFGNQAQLYFDLSIQDVYVPFKCGATTILISNRMYTSPVRVWKTILEKKVNTIVWIPSMISMFANLDILEHVDKADLKTVLFCGEVMPTKQLNYWMDRYPDTVFANLYGPTECTEACTYYTIDRKFQDDEVLPIGIPCENSDILILDDDGEQITEPGTIGELCIRGTCLSDGYYGDMEKTKEAFVQNPINNKYPEIIYKTGDLVSLNEKYELMYVSRKDYQIKIRGYRVELGEIESAASSIRGVTYCCCLFDDDNERLVLIYTGDVEEVSVRETLAGKLQDYMIPDMCIQIEKMLFNMNGKIDRKELKSIYLG